MATEQKTAIYAPPRKGLPFLVVAVTDGEASILQTAPSHTEARKILTARLPKGKPEGRPAD